MEEGQEEGSFFNPRILAGIITCIIVGSVFLYLRLSLVAPTSTKRVLAAKTSVTKPPTPTLTPTPTNVPQEHLLQGSHEPTPTPTEIPTPLPTDTPMPQEHLLQSHGGTRFTEPSSSGVPSADPTNDSVWDQLADCESHQNWADDTGNGYYGGLQFSLSAWQSVGGMGNPAQASRDEQIMRGKMLQARRGWYPWVACGRKLGLY